MLRKNGFPIILTMLLSLFSVHAWSQCGANISQNDAQALINGDPGIILVDVREVSEFCHENPPAPLPPGHIPGALNYPWTSGVLSDRYAELSMEADILIICRSGGRGAVATAFLCEQGFLSVRNISGGMLAWTGETVLCEPLFKRGDTNLDTAIDLADAVYLLTYLFTDGAAPACQDTGDSNDDGVMDLSDAITILTYLFSDDPNPPLLGGDCANDPTEDALTCTLYPSCAED